MASFTIVRVATCSETPPHSPRNHLKSLCKQLCPQLLKNPPPFHQIPPALQLEQAMDIHSTPNIQSCCIIPHWQMSKSRYLGCAIPSQAPQFLLKSSEFFTARVWSFFHLCDSYIVQESQAQPSRQVGLRNSGKKWCFVFQQTSDYIKERNCCAVHAAQEGQNLQLNF